MTKKVCLKKNQKQTETFNKLSLGYKLHESRDFASHIHSGILSAQLVSGMQEVLSQFLKKKKNGSSVSTKFDLASLQNHPEEMALTRDPGLYSLAQKFPSPQVPRFTLSPALRGLPLQPVTLVPDRKVHCFTSWMLAFQKLAWTRLVPPPANKPLWSSSQLCLYGQNEKKLGGGGKRVEAMREVQKSTTQMGSHLAWGGRGSIDQYPDQKPMEISSSTHYLVAVRLSTSHFTSLIHSLLMQKMT